MQYTIVLSLPQSSSQQRHTHSFDFTDVTLYCCGSTWLYCCRSSNYKTKQPSSRLYSENEYEVLLLLFSKNDSRSRNISYLSGNLTNVHKTIRKNTKTWNSNLSLTRSIVPRKDWTQTLSVAVLEEATKYSMSHVTHWFKEQCSQIYYLDLFPK